MVHNPHSSDDPCLVPASAFGSSRAVWFEKRIYSLSTHHGGVLIFRDPTKNSCVAFRRILLARFCLEGSFRCLDFSFCVLLTRVDTFYDREQISGGHSQGAARRCGILQVAWVPPHPVPSWARTALPAREGLGRGE